MENKKKKEQDFFEVKSLSDVFWLVATLIFIFPFIPFLAIMLFFD